MSQWWSWALTVNGLVGLWLVARLARKGWIVLIGNEILWVAYAFSTRQWGFIAMAVTYGAVYVVAYQKWTRIPLPPPPPQKW